MLVGPGAVCRAGGAARTAMGYRRRRHGAQGGGRQIRLGTHKSIRQSFNIVNRASNQVFRTKQRPNRLNKKPSIIDQALKYYTTVAVVINYLSQPLL